MLCSMLFALSSFAVGPNRTTAASKQNGKLPSPSNQAAVPLESSSPPETVPFVVPLSDSASSTKEVASPEEIKPSLAKMGGICSFCAKPRGSLGAATIDVASGYPLWLSLRAMFSLFSASPAFDRFGFTAGLGLRTGLQEVFVDIILLTHIYTNQRFSIAGQIVGSLGGLIDPNPYLENQKTRFQGGLTAGLIATLKFEPRVFLSLHAAFEYKGVQGVLVGYSQPSDPSQTVIYERSPSVVGFLLEPIVEINVHKYINVFAKGGYTFRFPTQDYDFSMPHVFLSNWHVVAGVTIKLGTESKG